MVKNAALATFQWKVMFWYNKNIIFVDRGETNFKAYFYEQFFTENSVLLCCVKLYKLTFATNKRMYVWVKKTWFANFFLLTGRKQPSNGNIIRLFRKLSGRWKYCQVVGNFARSKIVSFIEYPAGPRVSFDLKFSFTKVKKQSFYFYKQFWTFKIQPHTILKILRWNDLSQIKLFDCSYLSLNDE